MRHWPRLCVAVGGCDYDPFVGPQYQIFMKKIRTDQAALRLFNSACGSNASSISAHASRRCEQIPVTTFEILDHVAQLLRGSCCIELKNSADDMVGPSLIGWVEVSGFSRRFEGSHHDPGGIWTQVQDLSVQELGLRQGGPLGSLAV